MTLAMLRRVIHISVLLLLCSVSAAAAGNRARVFSARFDAVWTAADSVAKDAFLLDHSSREKGLLRFRAGPFRGYRFEVGVVESAPGKTRVQLELKTNLRGIEKDAWRNADRYLDLISKRLNGASK